VTGFFEGMRENILHIFWAYVTSYVLLKFRKAKASTEKYASFRIPLKIESLRDYLVY
jgi:hypothetical protein